MRRPYLILVAAVAGLGSGFAYRWIQKGGALTGNAPAHSSALASVAGGKSGAKDSVLGQKHSPLTVELGQRLTVSSGVLRWLEWMAALESAKVTDFPHLARMAKGNSVALHMIAARWIQLNPNHLLDTLIETASEADDANGFPRYELGQQLFEDWTARDPAGAVAALSRTGFPGNLRDLRYSVLNSVMKKDPELGITTMADWHIDNYGADRASIAKWAAANPQHAAEFALAHPAGYMTQGAVAEIGKAWAKTNPEEALAFSAGLKDKYGVALAASIVKEWSAKDMNKAAEWLAAADPAVRGRLSGPMVEQWAKSDTAGAMEWIQQNMSGSSMDEAIGAVLKGAADKDVNAAAALVAGMDASTGRAKAAVSVAKNWFPQFDSSKPASPEAIAWLSSLDPSSIKHVMEQVQWQWAGSDPKSLCNFLLTPAGQNSPPYAFSGTAREMARKDPVEALEWAGKMPAESREAAISNVFSEWQNSQPAAAMEWLKKLPVNDPRRETYYLATIRDFFPPGVEAEQTAKALAAGNTGAVREAVQKLGISDEIKGRLMDRLQLK